VSDLFGPSSSRPLPKITYSSRNRDRLRLQHQQGEQEAGPALTVKEDVARKKVAAKKTAAVRHRISQEQLSPSRRSRRKHCGRVGDLSEWGVIKANMLANYDLQKLTDK
jgi:hypothetical protein